MTAICGLWRWDGQAGAAEDCERMRRTLAIYGRDRSGGWDGGDIALGIQLARLVPEDIHDRQPLTDDGRRFTMVADARIDNRPELAAELGVGDERLRTMADSDLMLVAWERWQSGCLDRLYGDFALAVWDTQTRTLQLARDPLGQRPLFYHLGDGFAAFATMAKGLHALAEVPVAPDLDTLRDYLALAPMRGPGSFFAGIRRVEPGGLVTLHADGRAESRDWYEWRLDRQLSLDSDEAYVTAFRALFDRAVSDRLRATGPIASHLSGGRDSSAVTATAAVMLAARGQRLTAYTHVPLAGVPLDEPPGRFGDEGPLAATVAALYPNIDHVLVDAADRQIGDSLDAHFHAAEYPALNLCNKVWTSEIDRLAGRARAKVMLTGGAGNMTISISGEERLTELFWSGDWPTWITESRAARRAGHGWLGTWLGRPILPRVPPWLFKVLRAVRGQPIATIGDFSALRGAIIDSASFRKRLRDLAYDPTFRPRASVRSLIAAVLRRMDIQGLEQKGRLALAGVDHRDPTADRRLVEFVLAAPTEMFFRNGRARWLYQHAFADRVPDEIRNQRAKGQQLADWFERLRRAQPSIIDISGWIGDSVQADSLTDTDGLTSLASAPLPGASSSPERNRLRLRLLRGLSVGHFVRKLDKTNNRGAV